MVAPPLDSDVSLTACDIGFQIAAQSPEAIDKGEYLLFSNGFTTSMGAARSMGRFMHLLDGRALNRAREIASREFDQVHRAELVYAPVDGRMYNVFIRPAFVDSEIHFGVVSSDRDVVRLDDLWVGIDQERFFLWSAARNCRIIPIESHVFNTSRLAPNVCQLLSLIADEEARALRPFSWGEAHRLTSLPRLRVGRIVLSLRSWRFAVKEFGISPTDADRTIERLRAEWAMPRYVVLVEGDNRLLFDLDSACTGALLNDRIHKDASDVFFQEFLPSRESWLRDESGCSYTAEFIASVTPWRKASVANRRPVCIVTDRKGYGPGSHWLFAKVYLGSQALEHFLLSSVLPLVKRWRSSGALDVWFFLRYSDSSSHLRIRFQLSIDRKDGLRSEFLNEIERHMMEGTIDRYVLDTYDPEYERYGGAERLQAAERFFSADSDFCVELLRGAERSSDARIALAARSFAECINGCSNLRELALEAFVDYARGKMSSLDRVAVKAPITIEVPPEMRDQLAAALDGEDRRQRLRSLFHMHCNRLGVLPQVERRAIMMLRALVLKRHFQVKAR